MKQNYFKSLLIAMLVLFGSGGAFADTYELYSGTITEGEYLLVYEGSAMNTTVSNNRLQFQAVQIVDDKITSGTTDFSTIVWTITKSGNYYTLYNASAGKYAASTGTKNQAGLLDSGTDDKSLWTITGSGPYEFVNKYNDAHNINKNLRKNGTYGFACYATSTGGSLLLYKKVTSVSPLSSIAVEGYKSTFHQGDSFEFGGTVTATYEDGTTNDVTNLATFSEPDMTTVGEKEITVSYTEREVTKTVTYNITVTAPGEENPNNSFAVEEDNATIGEPYTMPEFTTSSDGAMSYSSSNTDVATISSSGQITLKKFGTTTITVTTAQTETYAQGSASYILHVAKGTPVLSFAQETVTVYLGTPQNGPTLTNPSGIAVIYNISNPNIATIQSNGYIQPKAAGTATVTVTPADPDAWEATASYTLEVKAAFSVDAVGTYELVTDVSTLADGDQILISYIPSDGAGGYVLGEKQSNNFKATLIKPVAVSADKSTIEITSTSQNDPVDPVTAAILEVAPDNNGKKWYFHTNNGYLYAASSSSNYLRTASLAVAGDNAKAEIVIDDDGAATVTFQGTNKNKILRYNSSSKLFSCYSSGQTPVQIYRKIILPKVPISFAESVVEITYGDNYNKQAATTEGYSGSLVYTSSDESVVKFHGNNVIDILRPGTVTITATAPATETTEESSAIYTLKVYAPADASEALNEDFSACNGTNNNWGGSSGFVTITGLGWATTNCQAGPEYLKLGDTDNAGSATSPAFSVAGEAPLSFDLAPWVANDDTENATVNVSLTNATFANEESTMTLSTGNLNKKKFTKFDQYMIKGNSKAVTITFSGGGSYNRFFLDNVIVGGGAHEINLTFSSAGYLTWVATADIDFSQTEGVTAYQITEATSEGITAEEVAKVPKNAAVMLKGSGTVELKRTSDVAALANNKMLACTDGSVTGMTGDQTTTSIYVLGNGSNGLGYYMLKNTLQAGKGYLNISGGASAKPSFIAFEETEPTGISGVSADSADGVYYNLQGVRVLNPQKGIYIKDGKKIVIK